MENTKICKKCGRELPLECFSKRKASNDGLQDWCKECTKQYNKQNYAEHREERLEYKKQWRADNSDYDKQWHAEHRDERIEKMKQYNAERYATIEGYAYNVRHHNLRADRKHGRCGKDEDLLPPLEYYIWALQQPDFYDGKQYHWSEMGLDRIYNDKPHTFANVVPCSTKNNRRRGRKSFEEFVELMRKENEELALACS